MDWWKVIVSLFVSTDFSTSTEFTFWNIKLSKLFLKAIKKLSIFQTKQNHSDTSVSESIIFVFAHARLDHFHFPKKTKKNGEILKIWKVLQERNLLPNRDWKIENSEEKEEEKLYHNLKVYANFRG